MFLKNIALLIIQTLCSRKNENKVVIVMNFDKFWQKLSEKSEQEVQSYLVGGTFKFFFPKKNFYGGKNSPNTKKRNTGLIFFKYPVRPLYQPAITFLSPPIQWNFQFSLANYFIHLFFNEISTHTKWIKTEIK